MPAAPGIQSVPPLVDGSLCRLSDSTRLPGTSYTVVPLTPRRRRLLPRSSGRNLPWGPRDEQRSGSDGLS